jgi:hypothetical protein
MDASVYYQANNVFRSEGKDWVRFAYFSPV